MWSNDGNYNVILEGSHQKVKSGWQRDFCFKFFSKYYDGEGDTIIKDPRVFRIVNIVKIVLLFENSND